MNDATMVIVGAGQAGAVAAVGLREEGFDGRILLVGEESHQPYERPKLSKEYLRGEVAAEALAVHPPDVLSGASIEVLTSRRVVELRPAERSVVLDDGRAVSYDGLLLATGSAARGIPTTGNRPAGLHLLRTLDDADRLRDAASRASTAVVAGGGWIAAETAASLRQLGLDVTLAVPGQVPLERSLGLEVGGIYGRAHRDHGVDILSRARLTGVERDGDRNVIRFTDGSTLRADLVVLGLGATPRAELAVAAGLEVGDGVTVDEYLATSAPGVFAAGDVAATWNPRLGSRVRSEHWDNALGQGRVAAGNLLGRRQVYDPLPYVFSDQFDLGMEYVGVGRPGDQVVVRGAPQEGTFQAFWLRDGAVRAGMQVNDWDSMDTIRRLVGAAAVVDPSELADSSRPLEDLVGPPSSLGVR